MCSDHKPDGDFYPSPHWGEYHGLHLHLDRLRMGMIHELLQLISDNKGVLEEAAFKEVVKKLSKDARNHWLPLTEIALSGTSSSPGYNSLARIRNKAVFHYDLDELLKAYKKRYVVDKLQPTYISLGDTPGRTRFFFADGAVQEYLNLVANIDKDLPKVFSERSRNIVFALKQIVERFIQHRGFAWREVKP